MSTYIKCAYNTYAASLFVGDLPVYGLRIVPQTLLKPPVAILVSDF